MSNAFQKGLIKKKARRKKKKGKITPNERSRFDWINVDGRMIKKPPATDGVDYIESISSQLPVKKPKPKKSKDPRGFWERAMQTSAVHDEFSVKSIVISIVLASLILAGSFFFASKIAKIMIADAEEKSGSKKEIYIQPRF
jgi:hypothetical protein